MRATLLLALFLATPAVAQTDYSRVVIKPETLAPGVHVLFGAGGNIGVSTGADATVLIDDQYAPLTSKILAAVATLSPAPVKFVINTHWHGDHSGGNENLGKAGAVIVAHDNVRTRMSSKQVNTLFKVTIPASPPAALPVITFAEGTTLHLNGEDIRAVHVAPAHTDGDTLVVFTKANVIHMGDTYFSAGYPFVDLESGGSVPGLIAALDRGLALGNATTKYIPGHGPVTDRTGLTAYRGMIAAIVAKIRPAVAARQPVEAVIAAKPTAAYDAKWGGGFVNSEAFVRTIYASLSGK